jgi:hypothetical protein
MKINKVVLGSLVVATTITLVADSFVYPRGFAREMTDRSSATFEHYQAADSCSEIEPKGSWRLPTTNELMTLCSPGQVSPDYNCQVDYLWTSERVESEEVASQNGEGAWLGIRPTTHEWIHGSYWDNFYYRCVK